MLLVALLLLQGAPLSGSQPGAPQNITYDLVDSRTVKVFWNLSSHGIVDKYDVSYKPALANFKVVTIVAGNCKSVTLNDLKPDVQYHLTVTAVRAGVKARSRPLVFRTMPPLTSTISLSEPTSTVLPPILANTDDPPAVLTSVTVRGVEISLVLLALCVWIFAITLFFHRWGKIRMLLPYQPDYKTQQSLKVPGTGSSLAGGSAHADGSHHDGPGCVQVVSRSISNFMQHLRWSSRYLDEPQQHQQPSRICSRWSSRQRLSSFAGYATDDYPDLQSQMSLNRLSIPVPQQRRYSRGSLYSLVDCLKARQELMPEAQPLFPEPIEPTEETMKETILDAPLPQQSQRRFNRFGSLKNPKMKTMDDGDNPRRQLTPAEMKRKTFLRKISLQETHINYNQDYWLEYDKSTRFHASLDLEYFQNLNETKQGIGPQQQQQQQQQQIVAKSNNSNPTTTTRQSDLPYNNKTKKRLFLRGDSEPSIVVRKCCCNETEESSSSSRDVFSTSNYLVNAIQSPSLENLPFLERVGHIETEFEISNDDNADDDDLSNAFSDVSLHLASSSSPKSITFDFNGGSAFFGDCGRLRSDSLSSTSSLKIQQQQQQDKQQNEQLLDYRPCYDDVPQVSVTRPSNSPSPRNSFINFK